MENDQTEAQLQDILARINELPEDRRGPLLEMIAENRRRHATIRDKYVRSQEALADWRLIQKYLAFDAEARQREAQAQDSSSDEASEF